MQLTYENGYLKFDAGDDKQAATGIYNVFYRLEAINGALVQHGNVFKVKCGDKADAKELKRLFFSFPEMQSFQSEFDQRLKDLPEGKSSIYSSLMPVKLNYDDSTKKLILSIGSNAEAGLLMDNLSLLPGYNRGSRGDSREIMIGCQNEAELDNLKRTVFDNSKCKSFNIDIEQVRSKVPAGETRPAIDVLGNYSARWQKLHDDFMGQGGSARISSMDRHVESDTRVKVSNFGDMINRKMAITDRDEQFLNLELLEKIEALRDGMYRNRSARAMANHNINKIEELTKLGNDIDKYGKMFAAFRRNAAANPNNDLVALPEELQGYIVKLLAETPSATVQNSISTTQNNPISKQ